MSIDHVKAKHAHRTATVRVLANQQIIAEHAAANDRLRATLAETTTMAPADEVIALRDRVEALQRRMIDDADEFTVSGIGRGAWLDLVAKHPATPEERAAGDDVHLETFAPAAVAASCVDPVLDVEDATWLAENLNVAEWERLWRAVLSVNIGEADLPKSELVSVIQLLNERSSTTARPAASRGASSSAGSGRTPKTRPSRSGSPRTSKPRSRG